MSRFLCALGSKNWTAALLLPPIQKPSAFRSVIVSSARPGSAGEGLHHTSNLDKKILVWTKRYPSIDKVPQEVTEAKMKKAKDVFRVRVSVAMALAIWGFGVLYVSLRRYERWQNPREPSPSDPKPPY